MAKTERLYYNDPYLLEFEASIIEERPMDGRHGVVLDRTAFYPTSGGQPNDLGFMNGVELLDVIDDEVSGQIVHVTAGPLGSAKVRGSVNAARRRDHIQQHSGQHVLSQAFVELFNWPTVSFHLGATVCTIDLPAEAVTREQAARAEDLANRVVEENRAVAVCYVDSQNIGEAGLRKATERSGEIRVIDIAGYDKSACGGTHVRMTGEIGPILITRIERIRKQTRLEFLCGGRVVRFAREANRVLESISQAISSPPMESAAAVKSLWDEQQRSRKRIEDLESKLLDVEAAEFPLENGLAVAAFRGRGIETVKLLAQKICSRPGVAALLVDESDQLRVVFGSSRPDVDAAALLKKTIEKFGGRGGGKANLAQGGGLTAESGAAVLGFVRGLVQ